MSIDHLEVLERYSEAFTGAVAGRLAEPVPSCPGWVVDDLVGHLAEVQAWWTSVVSARGAFPDEQAARRAGETGPDRVAGWREINARYLAAQCDCPADAVLWVWWNQEEKDTAAALASRQAHEVVVHCWDAENATGTPRPIPAGLAADGVDEFFERFLGGPEWTEGPFTLALEATDVDRTWAVGAPEGGKPRLLATPGAPAVPDTPAAPDTPGATITGTAEQLYLLLWRRVGPGAVTVAGSRATAEAFLSWPRLT